MVHVASIQGAGPFPPRAPGRGRRRGRARLRGVGAVGAVRRCRARRWKAVSTSRRCCSCSSPLMSNRPLLRRRLFIRWGVTSSKMP